MLDPAPALLLEGVTCAYGDRVALEAMSLDVRPGELFAVLGPSGSGKSTLLRAVAGFERPVRGRISCAGRVMSADDVWVEPHLRGIGLVPQGDSLFPHLTVADNVAFGVRRTPDRATEALTLVGLSDRASSYPGDLSGGERQRVALARALAPGPTLVLLDEPFSAIDAELRVRLRRQVVDIVRQAGATAVVVTHDQEEALALADRIAVVRDGRLVQCGRPADVYWSPADRWVAGFLGEINALPARPDGEAVVTALGRFQLPVAASGDVGEVGVRPEALTLRDGGTATVMSREFRGRDVRYLVRDQGLGDVTVLTRSDALFDPGAAVTVLARDGAPAVLLHDETA